MVSRVERAGGGRIMPALRYRNASAAIDWLCKAFGFEKKMVVPAEGGQVAHAELVLGNGMIMLGDAESEYGRMVRPPAPPELINTQGTYVVVDDADSHYARAKAAGAEIIRELVTQDYGGRATLPATSKAISGPSAPTIRGPLSKGSARRIAR